MPRPSQSIPEVAPYRSCIACFKGDTDTGFVIQGESEWIMVAMHKLAGIPLADARATFAYWAEDVMGCDPGMVPVGEVTHAVRLCRDCARKTGVTLAPNVEAKGDLPTYVQPPDQRLDNAIGGEPT